MAVQRFTWPSAADQNLGPTRWIFGITKLDGLPNRTYPGRSSQDLSATCCSRWHRRFSFPFMSIFTNVGKHFVWTVRTDENIRTQERSLVPSIWLELSTENWLHAGTASGLQSQGWQRDSKDWMFALNMSCHVSHILKPSMIANLL